MLPVGTIECLKVTPLISLCCFIVEWMFIQSVTVLELLGCHVDGVKNEGI